MEAYSIDDVGVGTFETSVGFTPSTWPENTQIILYSVPWDSDYRDIVYFASESARTTYFSGLSSDAITLAYATYCKPNEPIEIPTPYATAYLYNYVRVINPDLPTDDSGNAQPELFYFITGVSFIAPNTTRLYLQLDVWTTYGIGVWFPRAFVERGHVAIHAYNQATSYTVPQRVRRYLTAPEGLDVGSSYVDVNETSYSLVGDSSDSLNTWWIIVVSAVDMVTSSPSTKFGTVSNPKLETATGALVDGMVSGCDIYAFTPANFITFMGVISDYPWIATQILSIFAYPMQYCSWGSSATTIAGVTGMSVPSIETNQRRLSGGTFILSSVRSFLQTNMESEFSIHPKSLAYPFSWVKCDNLCSNPLTLRYELMYSDTLSFNLFECYLPPYTSAFVTPVNYGASVSGTISQSQYLPNGNTFTGSVTYGDKLATSLVWRDFPQFSIVNDSYINYLASNAHSIQYSRDNASWQLDKSNANINTSYDNANRSLGAAQTNQQLAYETQRDISRYSMGNLVGNQLRDTYNALSSGTQGGVNALFGTDVATVINTTVNAATGQTANEIGNTQFQSSMAAQQGNIDANYKLQQWAARGDYEQAIAGIDASVQDAQILPPTQSGTLAGGMCAILASRGLLKFFISAMIPLPNAQHKIASFWDRFGYAVGEYMTDGIANDELLLNDRFTYWKLADTVLGSTTAFDDGVRNAIRGIFEKGVTIWADADYINDGNANDYANNAINVTGYPLY